MLSELPRDFSKFESIFCCKAVPRVGGTVFAVVLRDNELKGRGCGRGGDVNKLSAALSRSALEPVNESMSSPSRSNSSSFEVEVRHLCFLIYHFLCEIFNICSSVKDTGVITRDRFPTGRAVIMCVKRKAKVPTLARSQFVFIRLAGRHFKHNKIRTKKPEPRKTQNTQI